jgi:hypothetical protein
MCRALRWGRDAAVCTAHLYCDGVHDAVTQRGTAGQPTKPRVASRHGQQQSCNNVALLEKCFVYKENAAPVQKDDVNAGRDVHGAAL